MTKRETLQDFSFFSRKQANITAFLSAEQISGSTSRRFQFAFVHDCVAQDACAIKESGQEIEQNRHAKAWNVNH